jgi:hypothetical protein
MKSDTQPGARLDAIDRILASDDPLVPSSGFVASVMERVRDEAAAPPPIPFPWKRALPGIVLVAGTIGWLIYEFIRIALAGTFSGALSGILTSPIAMPHIPAAAQQALIPALWTALALVLSLASWALSRRLTRRSSLL